MLLGDVDQAMDCYLQAKEFYITEQGIVGLAYSLSEPCYCYSINFDKDSSLQLIEEINRILNDVPYEIVKSTVIIE